MTTFLSLYLGSTGLYLAMRFTPPVYRMFCARRVWHTREYLDQEEFLRHSRSEALVWWEGFHD